ncbi:MAG: fxsA [Bacillales bacterium]|nr:fxsA [Bacillales bacterium]
MKRHILLIILVLCIIELFIFLFLAKHFNFFTPILLAMATSGIGIYLLIKRGRGLIVDIQRNLYWGKVPREELGDGVLIVIGAVLMFLPGFLTDIVGITFFIPATQFYWKSIIYKFFSKRRYY